MRTPCCDKNGLKKGTWTAEEDRKLKAYITRYGCWNWRQLPKFAGLSRCGKSCRLRWMNYLRPNIKRGNFSKEEEDLIINLHESLGNRWSAIAAQLPGRTDNEIKNHWHTYLKKCTRQQIPISQAQKPRSNDRSKSKKTGQKTSKFKISSVSPSTHQIFESSQFSPPPPPPLSSELCSLMIDTATVNSPSSIAENDVSPSEMFAETNASFWTDPIFVDNYDNTYDVLSPLVVDTGFLSTHTPVIDEEFLCSYNFYDEFNNVLNW
ncbi:unnamed protein product [Camellia sinensis]